VQFYMAGPSDPSCRYATGFAHPMRFRCCASSKRRDGSAWSLRPGSCPGDGRGVFSRLIGGHGNFVMLTDAAAFLFQPADKLFISNSPSACCCSTRSMAGLLLPYAAAWTGLGPGPTLIFRATCPRGRADVVEEHGRQHEWGRYRKHPPNPAWSETWRSQALVTTNSNSAPSSGVADRKASSSAMRALCVSPCVRQVVA
jgi:hypothetical protein